MRPAEKLNCTHRRVRQVDPPNDQHNGIDYCPTCETSWITLKHSLEYIELTIPIMENKKE